MIQARRKMVFQAKKSQAKINTISRHPRLSSMVDFAKDLFTLSLLATGSIVLMYAVYAIRVA